MSSPLPAITRSLSAPGIHNVVAVISLDDVVAAILKNNVVASIGLVVTVLAQNQVFVSIANIDAIGNTLDNILTVVKSF